VFYRCTTLEDALSFRSDMDNRARGIQDIGEKSMEIVERDIKEKPIATKIFETLAPKKTK
jgi:hypothetical protein